MENYAKNWFSYPSAHVMTAIAVSVMLIFSVTGMNAFADNIQDDIQVSPPERTITIPGINNDGTLQDASTTVKYWVFANSAGGLQGCDASDGSSVTVRLIVPSGAVRVSPESLTFNQCGDASTNTKSATYTSNKPGDYVITVSAQDSNGRYNTGDATFLLHVRPPVPPSDTTNPTISISSPDNGATLTEDSFTVSGTASDSGSGIEKVEVQIDDGSYNTATGTSSWSFDVTNLEEGTHTITAKATDKAGNSATESIEVTYTPPDTTAPTLKLPSDITAEATSADGIEVSYTATATDAVDGSVPVTCDPASGSTFPLGTTTVNCSATDAAGNEATGSFNVIVQDTTPPELTLPSSQPAAEATTPQGAQVTYAAATATDAVDGSVPVTCDPASGSTFPLGTTTVDCSATDAAGNTGTGSFNVIVQDTTKPEIQVTSSISNGQEFYFGDVPGAPSCSATDIASGVNSDGCKVSAYTTPVGSHIVTFTATDNAGNTATQQITYKVLAWTIKGFYQPVDMNGVLNTVKGGSTVPLKFEVFKGGTELTDTSAIKTPLTAKRVNCDSGTTLDEIETVASGSTTLRYDSTTGQFIYNWQTPRQPGTCYDITVGTQDGSSVLAKFRLR